LWTVVFFKFIIENNISKGKKLINWERREKYLIEIIGSKLLGGTERVSPEILWMILTISPDSKKELFDSNSLYSSQSINLNIFQLLLLSEPFTSSPFSNVFPIYD